MIEQILPDRSVGVDVFEDPPEAKLWPEEEALVAGSVEKRRLEFTTARHCARQALAGLGAPPAALLSGPKREPLWPSGIVGSITHCTGYRAAVVAWDRDIASLGVDAEPNGPLPTGVLASIALDAERDRVEELLTQRPEVRWDRLLFSAKESVYKTWYPLARRWLDFDEADITFDPDRGTFDVRLLVPGPVLPGRGMLTQMTGRWLAQSSLVVTAITIDR
ncbi:4'-phosphopantetheinyl transferase superfamily protein [Dactylosporangium sp. NPDC051484]|uniref:4'-phosphopantetheinyl transferase family protein n=1 Tax=Dactylosporangium sp. NPDC051484 TaxID=3154942 RepID=UPI00344CA4C0